jgi:hypothetical protein
MCEILITLDSSAVARMWEVTNNPEHHICKVNVPLMHILFSLQEGKEANKLNYMGWEYSTQQADEKCTQKFSWKT